MMVLSIPTLFSLIAEPLTGLVDTAFISRLGAESLAALGVGTIVLSSIFWIFNFLSIGTQTEISQSFGSGDTQRASEIVGMGMLLAAGFGVIVAILGYPLTAIIATSMGAEDAVFDFSVTYIRIRLAGGPAILVTLVAFGALRGFQDMKSPLWIALAINGLNIILDAIFIFGIGFIPAFGIAGAAWASVAGQWIGAILAVWKVYTALGLPVQLVKSDVRKLFIIGGDLFIRTGLLTLFLILTTRTATMISANAGAAHQAIRQIWMFSALLLDAFAITGQSLVGYFIGAGAINHARRVAFVACSWGFWTGVMLAILMWLGESAVITFLVPASAVTLFSSAWYLSAIFQPMNALSFATDGLHWGTGDFRFLRNVVTLATVSGTLLLLFIETDQASALTSIWLITGIWISIRAALGISRIWPGIGNTPWKIA